MRPKLTIRDLFALVTMVALALAWGIDHQRQFRLQESLRSALLISEIDADVIKQTAETSDAIFIERIRGLEQELGRTESESTIGVDFDFVLDAHEGRHQDNATTKVH